MLAILAVLCPPLAVLLTATPAQAARNFGLTLLFYLPGALHARAAVEQYRVHRRYAVLLRALDARDGRAAPRPT
jgi:uncharacterized membrane protein YqaE (UPF0057 family)